MALKIFGPPQTRALRVLWMAQELGLEAEADPGFDFSTRTPNDALLSVNPMGQVPAIDDDGFHLAESMAITLYLCGKHGKLGPSNLQDQAQTLRWSFWVIAAVESQVLDVLLKTRGMMGQEVDKEGAQAGIEALQRPFNVLNDALAGRDYLLGSAFTVADLNVASVFTWAKAAGIDFSAQPNLATWLDRCLGREAFARAQKG